MLRRFAMSLVLLPFLLTQPASAAQQQISVDTVLEQMSPEERVGQLFLVTYYGTDLSEESDIASLISDYHVGGVVLVRENDNFTEEEDVVTSTQQTIRDLQTLNLPEPGPFSALTRQDVVVPLFVGLEYEPGTHTNPQILTELTPLPTKMSLGATWDENLAGEVGRVVGAELSALGFNLLLGPSVDVVQHPAESSANGLDSDVYGGHPFWVAEMASAYVQGIHIGSQDQMLVIAQHFPGFGSANRRPIEEIPSVHRDFAQLVSSDMVPFFALTGDAPAENSAADGLMTAHIRYVGLQPDSTRQPNRPISLDAQSLQLLLEVETINEWRESGGLLVSDSLGADGVALVYDAQGSTFQNRQIAQNAFSAGNDVLYLKDFGLNPPVDQTENTIDTIETFVQQYEDNDTFREQVDASVRRILEKKLGLYGEFSEDAVLGDSMQPLPEQQPDLTRLIAQRSVTLVAPAQAEALIPPERDETIVIFTDTRPLSQCDLCEPRSSIAPDALESSILRLYGPQAVFIVEDADIQSFTFTELNTFLSSEAVIGSVTPADDGVEEQAPDPVSIALNAADWLVFVMLDDVGASADQSNTVSRFLAQRPNSSQQSVVVMAMGAPYYLDSTEVNKLTAMYALYGSSEAHIDVAARALFQDVAFAGASPISISGINYNIDEVVRPDSEQTINLTLVIERGATGQVVPETRVQEGDTLRVRTGQIIDQNGNPVPDGTSVEFFIDYVDDAVRDVIVGEVINGSAEAEYLIQRPGDLVITAASDPALSSAAIRIVGGIPETPVPPTPFPTQTPVPQLEVEEPEPPSQPSSVNFGDLFLALIGLLFVTLTIFFVASEQRDLNHGLLLALPAFLFGLVAYNYYVLLLPGSAAWTNIFGDGWAASLAAWAGAGVGLALVIGVLNLREQTTSG